MNKSTGESTLESMSEAVWYNQWTLKKLEPFLRGDILEVGCGIGNFTDQLTSFGNVWAIDIKERYITKLKKKKNRKFKVGLGDIEDGKYFFGDKKFDTIVCINVLEHILNDKTAIKNLGKLLNPEGMLLLLVPSHPLLFGKIDESIGHFRRYDKLSLASLVKSIGLNIIYSRKINLLGACGWFISGKIFKNAIVKKQQLKLFNFIAPIILPVEDLVEPVFGTSILMFARKDP